MKKIIFIFILFFIFLFNVNASESFHLEKKLDIGVYATNGVDVHNRAVYVLMSDSGKIVYCLNPFKLINTHEQYEENYELNDYLNGDYVLLNKINLIAYYGYGYGNHTDIKWYAITQFVIWKNLGMTDIYFIDSNGNKIDYYNDEVLELENLVDSYYSWPEFTYETFELSINDSYDIVDSNNSLYQYHIDESNIDAYIDNNTLHINTSEVGHFDIYFSADKLGSNSYILYTLDGSQTLIYPGYSDTKVFMVSVDVKGGTINIKKEDSENIDRDFSSLEGAAYGVYKDNELIEEVITDENGIAEINNLSLGKYQIKELIPSVGYNLDDNIYEVELTFDNNEAFINSKENVIKGNIIIDKYYGYENNYKKEDGAVFEIYDINDNLIGSYETLNGKIKKELDYGNYYVVQTSGLEGYNLVDKFDININEEKDYKYELYDEIQIVKVPNTRRNDYYRLTPYLLVIIGLLFIIKWILNKKSTTHFE